MKNLIVLGVVSLFFFGCHPGSDTPDQLAKKALFRKFPELGEDTAYVLVRKVYNARRAFTIALYESKKYNSQYILAHRGNKTAAIPLLTNDYPKFWSFDRTAREKRKHVTFTGELYTCIQKLGLDDTLLGPRSFMNELFSSVLHYGYLRPDSTYIHEIPISCGQPFAGDNTTRIEADFKEINRVLNTFEVRGYNAAFFDEQTNRVFLLEYQSEKLKSKLSEMEFHVLLHECPVQCLVM